MKNFQCVATGLDTLPLMHALQRAPELWNENTWRTTYKGTPHVDVDDIWLRYADQQATSDTGELAPVQNDTAPIWYPAFQKLPQVRPIIFDLMHRVGAYELGRVLITKIRSGGRILAHADASGAYTDRTDGGRYHIVLQGLPGSLFHGGDETVCMRTGEVWWFNHLAVHSVENNSTDDRIHLLVDTRNA